MVGGAATLRGENLAGLPTILCFRELLEIMKGRVLKGLLLGDEDDDEEEEEDDDDTATMTEEAEVESNIAIMIW